MQRLALRLYLLMVNVPETCTKQFRLHNGLNRCLNDMEYHPEQLKVCCIVFRLINIINFLMICIEYGPVSRHIELF